MRRLYVAVVLTTFVLLAAPAGRAWAHAGEQDVPAKDSIEEAIAIIASQPEQMDAIADKINDAFDANDQSGVDVSLLQLAQTAFEAGDLQQTMLLLERSVGAQPGQPVVYPNAGPRSPAIPLPADASFAHLRAIGGQRPGGTQTAVVLSFALLLAVVGAFAVKRFR